MSMFETILFWVYFVLVSLTGGSTIGFVSAAMLHVLVKGELPYKIIATTVLVMLLSLVILVSVILGTKGLLYVLFYLVVLVSTYYKFGLNTSEVH